MGVVYKAEDTNLGRMVALKFLPDELATHPPALERLRREARMIAALNHPGICTMYQLGEASGRVFLVMEFLEGESLRERMKREPLSESEIIDVGAQVARALEAAHGQGMVHRDIKPDNLFLTKQGVVKLMDFGLAKPVEDESGGAPQSSVTGTSGYMSPEQMGGESLDHRSDLFSFGVVIYEMLGGKRAFLDDSPVEVGNAALQGDPPELPASVPPVLAAIVHRCLEKEPGRRFQSAAELGSVLQSLSLSAAYAERPTRRPWLKWAAILAASTTVGFVYWLAVRSSGPSAPPETTLRRLTNDAGLTTDGTISPDGKLVASVRNGDIWVHQVDGSGVIRITDDPADDYAPVFSPDGTQIAFRSERAEGGIFIAPALGGEARQLVPQGRGPRFSPDGRWLMYWTGPANPNDVRGSREVKLFVQPISGGAATQIGAGCGLMERTPVWSPDGNRILFLGSCGSDVPIAWVSTVDGKDLKPNHDLYGLWPSIHSNPLIDQWIGSPPRLLIAMPVADANYAMTVPVSADGTKVTGSPLRLTTFSDNVTRVSAALDGRMALSVSAATSHIWSLPIDRTGRATGEPKQLTFGSAGENDPSLSRDGEKLAFISRRSNVNRLFYKDLATGREKEVSTEGYRYATPVFNPDGTKIMCAQYPGAESWRAFVFEVPLSSGLSRKVWDKAAWTFLYDWSPTAGQC